MNHMPILAAKRPKRPNRPTYEMVVNIENGTDTFLVQQAIEQTVRNVVLEDDLTYDPATNVTTIFNRIQEFQDICQLVGQPKQDFQLVNHAYLIFQKELAF